MSEWNAPTHHVHVHYFTETGQAFVDPTALLGPGVRIWHFARVMQNVTLGRKVVIGGGTEIGRESVIGDGTRIQANCFLPSRSQIGKNVFIGPNVTFTDDRYPYVHGPDDPDYTPEPPIVEDGASIGAGAVILPGVRIGTGAKVAAGAVVTEDVPGFTMFVGVPARERDVPASWLAHPDYRPPVVIGGEQEPDFP